MTEPTPQRLIESVVRITKHRDQISLEESWVVTLLDLLHALEVSLYRLDSVSGKLELAARAVHDSTEGRAVAAQLAGELSDGDAAYRCVRDSAVRIGTVNGNWRAVYPVMTEDHAVGAFAVTRRDPLDDDFMAVGFARIYQNYLAVLNDGQFDPLTGLLNRKTFDDRFDRILSSARKIGAVERSQGRRQSSGAGDCYWLGLLDIDHFKSINDTFGHLYGDEVLLLFAQLMRVTFRREDTLFRYGGEEFLVVLAPTDAESALQAFERFRTAVAMHEFPQVGRVTVSAGLVRLDETSFGVTAVGHADQALYYAKQTGRNRVYRYEDLVEQGKLRVADDPLHAAPEAVTIF